MGTSGQEDAQSIPSNTGLSSNVRTTEGAWTRGCLTIRLDKTRDSMIMLSTIQDPVSSISKSFKASKDRVVGAEGQK